MRINNINDLPEHLRKQIEQQIGPIKKRSKYNNEKTLVGDELVDSGHEAVRYGELQLLQQADEITALQSQVWFLIEPKNDKNRASYYIADFVYFDYRLKEWVIIGAETGNRKGKVIPKIEWIEKIVSECDRYNIPVFMKDSLIPIVGVENMLREFPEGLKK